MAWHRRSFKTPTDSFAKRLLLGFINERLKSQVFSFDDRRYTLPLLRNPFGVRKEMRHWRDSTLLYDDVHQGENDYAHDLLMGIILPMLSDRILPDAAIFDVGCNSGYFLRSLHAAGFRNLHGLDPQNSAIDFIRKTRPFISAKAGYFGPPENDVRAELVMFINSLDRIPYGAAVFEAIDRCADKYVIIATREFGESYKRDVHFELGLRGFLCLEKRTVSHAEPNEPRPDYEDILSVFLFRRLEPRTSAASAA